MTSIEVKRVGDGSVREFSNSEIGTGSLVNWVTENDPNADGLVRFINQANETGNATADSLSKFPKIVEDGSLKIDNDGETVADWDGLNDGILLSPDTEVDLQSNPKQTLSLKLEIDDPDNIPQHLARVNGINVYEEEGKIKVTVKDPDTSYRDAYDLPPRSFVNYKDSVYTLADLDKADDTIQRLNDSGNFESIDNSLSDFDNNAEGGGLTVHDGKLWGFKEYTRESIYSFSGSKQIDGHFFREDGKKLYVTDLYPDTSVIEEYTLSSAWDVDTASKDAELAKSNISGLFFRPNGEKMYVINNNLNEIYEYTLSNPWSLDSAQLNETKMLSSSSENPRDLYFRDDGTKLYVGNPGDNSGGSGYVSEYDLSTPWNLSTLSFKQDATIGEGGPIDLNGIYFRGDGNRLYVAGAEEQNDHHIYQFDLSTTWDITSASKTKKRALTAYANLDYKNRSGTLFFRNGGKFTVTKHNGQILEYKLFEDWNVHTSNYMEKNVVEDGKSGLTAEYDTSKLSDCCFGDNGSQFYILDKRKIESYSLSSDYDLSSTERDGEIYLAHRSYQSRAVWVGSNRAYVAKDGKITEYILHEPWNISSSQYNGQENFNGTFYSLYFKPDGSKFYGINRSQRVVRELELSTPWDISSASQINTYSPAENPPNLEAQLENIADIDFADNGNKLYLCDSVASVAEYNLTTPWDLSTASFSQFTDSRDAGPPSKGESYQSQGFQDFNYNTFIRSFAVSPSGDKSYYFSPCDCFEYDLQSNFDISTGSYNQTYGLSTNNFLLNCFFRYQGDLYATYFDADQGGTGGILKYDGQTFSHFLTCGKMSQIFEGDFNAREISTSPKGVGVFEDEIYFAPNAFDYNNQRVSSDRVFRYNPEDGWEQIFRFGYFSNTRSGVDTFSLLAYDGDLWAFEGVGPLYRWNEKEERFIRTSKYTSSRLVQAEHTVYDKEAYFSEDEIYRTDGLTQFTEDADRNSSSILRRNGELWISSQGIKKKGESVCIKKDYDKQSSEIEIKAAVADQYLFTEIDGQTTIKNHDLDYKNDGEIDLGLSLGSTNGDELAGVDEPYQGNISHLRWHPGITQNVFKKAVSKNAFELNLTVDYRTDSSVEGVGSTNNDLDDIQKIQVKRAGNVGGSYDIVKEVQDPSSNQVSFNDTGLTTGEEYYYKTVVISSYDNVSPLESSLTSAIAEYPKPTAPQILITSATPSQISGTITSPDPNIFFDKFNVYRSRSSGGPYSKVLEYNNVSSNTVSWTDNSVDSDKKYFYVATATKTAAPIESDYSNIESDRSTTEIREAWEDYSLGDKISEISTGLNFTNGSDWYIDDLLSKVGDQSLRSKDLSGGGTTRATIELSPTNRRQFYIHWGADNEDNSNGYGDQTILRRNGNDLKTLSGKDKSSRELLSIPGSTTTTMEVVYEKFDVDNYNSNSSYIYEIIDAPVLAPEFITNVTSNAEIEVDHSHSIGNDVDGDFAGFHVYINGSKVTSSPQSLDGTFTTNSLNRGNKTIGVTNVRPDGVESFEVKEEVRIPAVINLTATESSGDVNLSWNTADPNSDYYNVYRADTKQGNYTKINPSNVSNEYYTDDTVQAGKIYFYKVSSVDGSGKESSLSDEASNAFTVSEGETITLSDATESYLGIVVNGTLNIEGKVTLKIDSFFEVGSTGLVDGNANGFGPASGSHADGNGPGGGFGYSGEGAAGASYGGKGGTAPDYFSGSPSTYGDATTADIRQGSSGGNGDGNSVGGAGGAGLEVLANSGSFTTTIDGTLDFDGQKSQYDGSSFRAGSGGSGGGVYIESNVTGNGEITARGGDASAMDDDDGGPGGGGRLKAFSFGGNITTDVSPGLVPPNGDARSADPGTVAEISFKVPKNVQASYDANAGRVNITWTANSPDISHYNVYKADSSGDSYTQINSSNVTDKSYADQNVSEGEDYFYKVSSVDDAGNENSLSDEASVDTTPLYINKNSASKDAVSLEINFSTSPNEIKVYRSEYNDGPYNLIDTLNNPTTPVTYEDNSPFANSLNSYVATQVENGSESAFTESVDLIASNLFHRAGYQNGLGEWTANEDAFVQKTNYSFEGNASAGIQEPGSDIDNVVLGYWEASSARQPEMWEFFWRENSNSSGGGLRLLNSNGNYEVSFSTNNPQWVLSDGDQYNDTIKSDNGVYEDWVRVRIYFDWQNGEYDYEIENMNTGTSRSGSARSMENGLDIKRINLEIYNGNWFSSLPSGTGSKKTYWWQDSMYLGPDVISNTNIIEDSGGFTGTDANLQGRQQETIRTFEVGGNEHQLVVYYDNSQNTTVARRVNRGSWSVTSLDNSVFNTNKSGDDHITVGLFKDQNDYIHIHGGIHSDDLSSPSFYRRSASPLDSWDFQTTQGPPTFNIGTGTNSYTRPATDNSGNIYITYRSGSPGNADQKFAIYDESAEAWNPVTGFGSDGVLIKKGSSEPSDGELSIYMDHFPKFDSSGQMHVECTFRFDGGSRSTNNDQVHLVFDLANNKVKDLAGNVLADGAAVGYDDLTSEAKMEEANYAAWNAFCGWQLDSNDNPVAVHNKPDGNGNTQYYLYFWDGSAWNTLQLTSQSEKTDSLVDRSAPQLSIDQSDDTAYITGINPDESTEGLFLWTVPTPYNKYGKEVVSHAWLDPFIHASSHDDGKFKKDGVLDVFAAPVNPQYDGWVGVFEDILN